MAAFNVMSGLLVKFKFHYSIPVASLDPWKWGNCHGCQATCHGSHWQTHGDCHCMLSSVHQSYSTTSFWMHNSNSAWNVHQN